MEVALLFMHTHIAFSLEKVRSFSERTAASDHWSNTCLCLLLPSLFSVSLNLKPWFQCLSLSLHTSKAIRKPNMEFNLFLHNVCRKSVLYILITFEFLEVTCFICIIKEHRQGKRELSFFRSGGTVTDFGSFLGESHH